MLLWKLSYDCKPSSCVFLCFCPEKRQHTASFLFLSNRGLESRYELELGLGWGFSRARSGAELFKCPHKCRNTIVPVCVRQAVWKTFWKWFNGDFYFSLTHLCCWAQITAIQKIITHFESCWFSSIQNGFKCKNWKTALMVLDDQC